MNQILDYNPIKNSGGNSSSRTDKIVRFFAVLLILFAICLLAVGGYGFFKKNASKQNEIESSPTKAKIEIKQEDSQIIVSIEHDTPIEEVIYNWDTEKEKSIKGTGESTMEFTIPTIAGEHTLNVKVIDVNKVEKTESKLISSTIGEDKMNPTIDWEIVTVDEDGETAKKIKIKAADETAIDFVTYRWNDEEEQREDATEEEQKELEFNIDILKGQNDLVVVAVDKSNNKTTLTRPFSGVTRPDVKVTVSPDKKTIDVVCSHENGLKSISAKINDQEYIIEIEEGQKEAPFNLPLNEGNNKVEITAVSIDNTETPFTQEIVSDTTSTTEDEITITIKKNEDKPEYAYIEINTSGIIKEIRPSVNELDYEVPIEEEYPGINFDLPLEDGNNVVTVTVITQNGTEKSETKEISR